MEMFTQISAMVILFFVLYVFLTIAGTMLSMLQDRQRPVWPAAVAITPFVTLGVVYMFYPQHLLFDISMIYILLFCLFFMVYMVFAIRLYKNGMLSKKKCGECVDFSRK